MRGVPSFLSSLLSRPPAVAGDGAAVTVDGVAVPVRLRRNARAVRLSLRLAPEGDAVVVVVPAKAAEAQAVAFARKHVDWIRQQLAAQPVRVAFVAGAVVPILGEPHVLAHRPEARRGVWVEGGHVNVSGQAEHVTRRATDFFKARARHEIGARAPAMAEGLGRKIGRIAVRDPRTRWGSCNAHGDLAFSWRLVLAPERVLTYVVAHEVAHLAELNHSPRFWAVVDQLAPERREAQAWLKRHGRQLHCYG